MNKFIKKPIEKICMYLLISLLCTVVTIDFGHCWGSKNPISSNGFTSIGTTYNWDSKQNAFVCHNESYGNYLRACSQTTYSSIGVPLAEDEDYMSGSVSTNEVISFDLKDNSSEVGLRISNLKYSHPDKGDIYVDSDIVITDYADGPDGRRNKTESVAFFKYSRPIIWMSGVYALWIEQRFYYAGTKTPITITSNTTIVDVDDYQGIILKSTSGYTGNGQGTELHKNKNYNSTGFPAYVGDFGSVTNLPRQETSVAYNFSTSNCRFVYFDNSPSSATSGGQAINETLPEETGTKLNKSWHSYSNYNNWVYAGQKGHPFSYCGPKKYLRTYQENEYVDGEGVTVTEMRNVYDAKYKRLVNKGYTYAWLLYEYRYIIKEKKKSEERRWDNMALFSARNTYVPKEINQNPIVKNMTRNPSTESYEGDNIRISAEFEDMDEGDTIASWYKLKKDGQLIGEGKEINHNSNRGNYEFDSPVLQGNYQVEWFVKDQKGALGTGIFNYIINSKGTIVYPDPDPPPKPDPNPEESNTKTLIYHTDKWEEKRNIFNIFYYGDSTNAKANENYINLELLPKKRYKNVFWSGEKIMIQVMDSKSIDSVEVYLTDILGNHYKSNNNTEYKEVLKSDGANSYSGSIWSNEFYQKKNPSKPVLINVEICIKYTDGKSSILKELVFMDDYREYSQPYLKFA
ncbi:MAG: hypothetical protein RSA49_04930 [Anaerovoracaceae bacterium]